MDIYDFDGTLYQGDSTADFLRWCLKRHPSVALTLPRTALAAAACLGLGVIDKTRFKADLYRFLAEVPHVEQEVEAFWRTYETKIAGPCNSQPGDLVISASPEFLLRDMCTKRGLKLIASQVDPLTGEVLGPNCSGEQKLVRFREEYPSTSIERFYSDSRNDDPLARLAQSAFLVKNNTLLPWPKLN